MKWSFRLNHLKSYLKKKFTRQRLHSWLSGKNYPTMKEFLSIFENINRNPASCFVPENSKNFQKNFPVFDETIKLDEETVYFFDLGSLHIVASITLVYSLIRITFYRYDTDASLIPCETIYLRYY